jgi:outer membrane lipoprotein-sorting protein
VSMLRSRPALRWLVPSAAAVVVIGGGAAAGTIVASADPSLPDRSAAQLLVDVQTAKVDGLSGTIVESADLGLPAIAGALGGATGGASGSPDAGLTTLLAGSNTARVWYAGDQKVRLALLGTQGETDMIRNGTDLWFWSSSDKEATHSKLPADAAGKAPEDLSKVAPRTPQQAAEAALAAIDPTTKVTTTGAARVAGRDAYELVLSPKDTASLIGQVRLAIDAEHHIPLRVDVYAKNATSPAVRVAFQQISFAVPDAQQFTFNPPAGTKVTEKAASDVQKQGEAKLTPQEKAKLEKLRKDHAEGKPATGATPGEPRVIGKGWTSILELKAPSDKAAPKGAPKAGSGSEKQQLDGVLNALEKVSGSWGSGRLFAGTLFSVLITDDGRVFAGAVTPQALYQAAAK